MSFREDEIVSKSRKRHRCEWCQQTIDVGSLLIRVRGATDGEGYWQAKFHPECWRAEYFYWLEGDCYEWPGDRMARGRNDQKFGEPPEYTDRLVTEDELKRPWSYCGEWTPIRQTEPVEVK